MATSAVHESLPQPTTDLSQLNSVRPEYIYISGEEKTATTFSCSISERFEKMNSIGNCVVDKVHFTISSIDAASAKRFVRPSFGRLTGGGRADWIECAPVYEKVT